VKVLHTVPRADLRQAGIDYEAVVLLCCRLRQEETGVELLDTIKVRYTHLLISASSLSSRLTVYLTIKVPFTELLSVACSVAVALYHITLTATRSACSRITAVVSVMVVKSSYPSIQSLYDAFSQLYTVSYYYRYTVCRQQAVPLVKHV
jgi:hypothetical protein